jgi:hypothetical protein
MHTKGRLVMSLCITLVGAGVVVQALQWPFKAALFPLIVGVPVFLLALVDVLLTALEKGGTEHATVDFTFSGHEDKMLVRKRTLSIFSWILGFFFLVILVGFPIAVPLFVFCYLKIEGREGWLVTLAATFITWVCFYGLFVWFLNVPFMEGLLQKAFTSLNVAR